MNKTEYKSFKSSKQYNLNKIKDFNYQRSIDNINRYNRSKFFSNFGLVFRVLFLFFLVVLFARIVSILNGSSSNLTFSSFLEFLSNLNSTDINIRVSDFSIKNDWGLFNGLKDFFNKFTVSFGVIVWLFSNVLNVFMYILQFVRFLFA